MASNHLSNQLQGDGVIYVVDVQSNPSTDYFVLPEIALSGLKIIRCGFSELPPPEELVGAHVVFVRYVPPAWARLLDAAKPRLKGLIFFMDDDVLDIRASAGMPLRYRYKLARLAAWKKGWLKRHEAKLWVSTRYLEQKYKTWCPRLILPRPNMALPDFCRVFYHGSATHQAEIRWLYPVIEEVLRKDERIAFEIIGNREVFKLYAGLPRVTVVRPMKWPAYQAFLSMTGRHIGLAPLLDLPFNRARSYTKFFDITRCGAAGIYSPESACAEVVTHGEEGLVLALEKDSWVENILNLAADPSMREKLISNARKKLSLLAGGNQNVGPQPEITDTAPSSAATASG